MNLKQYTQTFERHFNKDYKEYFTSINDTLENLDTRLKHYSLEASKFYNNSNEIKISNRDNILIGKVTSTHDNHSYLSYETTDNKFTVEPKKSLLDIANVKQIQVEIDYTDSENLNLSPFLVTYKNGEKHSLIRIKTGYKEVNVDDFEKIRLTFRIAGHGDFTIKKISIRAVL